MIKRLLITGCLLLLVLASSNAQELNCTVQVLAQRLQSVDVRIFKTLETNIFEFMNNRKWTSDVFQPEERIEVSMLINITDELGAGRYRATVSIQVSRPVFNSSYSTPLLNYADKDWVFEYVEFQPIQFNENTFADNLTSMLAFYAYLAIALDYDSYSLKGGTKYFQEAQNVMNAIPSNIAEEVGGWRPFDSQRNRYWMVENHLNPRYEVMREVAYQYHIQGLDKMYENTPNGRQVILNSLKKMEQLSEDFPNVMILQMFFNAKREELIKMFEKASPNEKVQAQNLLLKIDATNQDKYQNLKK